MKENVLAKKKNGMAALMGILLLFAVSVAGIVFGAIAIERHSSSPMLAAGIVMLVAGIVMVVVSLILLCGLKVLKPQEALVLTLFGRYVGTLKEDGFYFVNPFCTSFNLAAKTKLSQSGDVSAASMLAAANGSTTVEAGSNKISLKIMTLNNNKQKINDCLGNPVEIGIAVTWRVVDTAKAVFNVDNYKEFLSLQCDSALRISCGSIRMTLRPTSTRQATASRTRACAVPVRSWQGRSAMRSRDVWRRPGSRSWKRGSLTSRMRRRSPR